MAFEERPLRSLGSAARVVSVMMKAKNFSRNSLPNNVFITTVLENSMFLDAFRCVFAGLIAKGSDGSGASGAIFFVKKSLRANM
jgi:hypothetical protein